MQMARAISSSRLWVMFAQQQQVLASAAAAAATHCSQIRFLNASSHLSMHTHQQQGSQQKQQHQQQRYLCQRQNFRDMRMQLHLSAVHQLRQWQPPQQQWYRQFNTQAAAVPSSRDLADILKLQLLQTKFPEEVEQIWLSHHESTNSHVATVMGKEEHTVLMARAAASPLFILPLRKAPQGFCTLLIQWQQQHALITTLDEYKQLGSNAPTHFLINCYNDLASSHGLVLLRGDVLNPTLINTAEARTVMELTRALYTDAESYRLAYSFNHTPDKFMFDELLKVLGMTARS